MGTLLSEESEPAVLPAMDAPIAYAEDGNGCDRPTVFRFCRDKIVRACQVGWTRLRWGWRMHALGARSMLLGGWLVRNPRAIAIGSRVMILPGFVLADLCPGRGTYPKIVIGDGVSIQFRFQCNAARSVIIGNNVLIASNVLITDSDHVLEPGGLPVTQNPRFITRPVRIEDNCWIGQNAVILKGVTIGRDSIVGANSVVTRSVPPCSVVAGNPARVVKRLASAAPAQAANRR